MKTVKSALLGKKQLVDTDADMLHIQLKEVIQQHRDLVITKLMGNLPAYLSYKFEVKTSRDMLIKAKGNLVDLKNTSVDLSFYDGVVQLLLTRPAAHLANEPFYREIDACLSACVLEK